MTRKKSKYLAVLAVLAVLLSPVAANAVPTTYFYTGAITACEPTLCGLAGLVTGDQVVGTITIDVGANDAFTIDNTFMDFDFLLGRGFVFVDPTVLVFDGSGTTDANGDFATGFLNGLFFAGLLDGLGATVFIDLVTGLMTAEVRSGSGFLAQVEGNFTNNFVVPEPVTVAILGLGLAGMGLARRRRNILVADRQDYPSVGCP